MHKGIQVTLNGAPFSTAVLPSAKSSANNTAEMGLPRVPISLLSHFNYFLAETFSKDLAKKLETACLRVSFLILEKPMMGSSGKRAERTFTRASDIDPPAKGGEKENRI